MLVLRILLMILYIIWLMDGHNEVTSAATRAKNQNASGMNSAQQEKPDRDQEKIEKGSQKTGQNQMQTLDRKRKKTGKKKSKKTGKKPPRKPARTKTPATTTSTTTTTVSTATTRTSTVTITTTTATTTITNPTTAAPVTDGECKTTGGSPCIFPFKDGGKTYNACANQAGRYYWCATELRNNGNYLYWSYCPEDGSCPLDGKPEEELTTNHVNFHSRMTTVPPVHPTTITTSTALPTGMSVAPNEIENKLTDTLQNLVMGESRSSSSQIFHMLDKKLETIIEEIGGKGGRSDQIKFGVVDAFEENLPAFEKLTLEANLVATDGNVRESKQFGKGWFDLSTVNVKESKSVYHQSDCCSACRQEYADTELVEKYDGTIKGCYCYKHLYKKDLSKVEPITITAPSEFSTHDCGAQPEGNNCRLTRNPLENCPQGFTHIKNELGNSLQFSNEIPYVVGSIDVCITDCNENRKCIGFLFTECNGGNCVLLYEGRERLVVNRDAWYVCAKVSSIKFSVQSICTRCQNDICKNTPHRVTVDSVDAAAAVFGPECSGRDTMAFIVASEMTGSSCDVKANCKFCKDEDKESCGVPALINFSANDELNEEECKNEMEQVLRNVAKGRQDRKISHTEDSGNIGQVTCDGTISYSSPNMQLRSVTPITVTGTGKKFRCYSYNKLKNSKNWIHQYVWDRELRIPLFSVTKLDAEDAKVKRVDNFKSDDKTKKQFEFCGEDASPKTPLGLVPNTNEYVNSGYDRGHLLASEMFRSFFPNKDALDESNRMSNIWPQHPACNRYGQWRQDERKIYKASQDCINNKGTFFVSHGLIPDKEQPTLPTVNIRKVLFSYVNYCCTVGSVSDQSGEIFITNNPDASNPKEKCTHFSPNTHQDYINELQQKLGKIDDPFVFKKDTTCIIGFKDKYKFP